MAKMGRKSGKGPILFEMGPYKIEQEITFRWPVWLNYGVAENEGERRGSV